MPTPTEIKHPHLTYCEKWDIYCPCIKCIKEMVLEEGIKDLEWELKFQCEKCTGFHEGSTLTEHLRTRIGHCDVMSFCS